MKKNASIKPRVTSTKNEPVTIKGTMIKKEIMITPEELMKITGKKSLEQITPVAEAINETMEKYDINTPLRKAHFLAQILHESGNLKHVKENLNYSSKGLMLIFRKYFTEPLAKAYHRKQAMIGDRVYANRMGNGNEASGDGSRFRGRGFIQITGRNNYTSLSEDLGVDFTEKPELLEDMKYMFLMSEYYH